MEFVCSNTQINFTHLCQQMFWPHDSNAIFEGKTDQLEHTNKIKNFYDNHSPLKFWNHAFQKV